jgi:hypothetical protein
MRYHYRRHQLYTIWRKANEVSKWPDHKAKHKRVERSYKVGRCDCVPEPLGDLIFRSVSEGERRDTTSTRQWLLNAPTKCFYEYARFPTSWAGLDHGDSVRTTQDGELFITKDHASATPM